MNMSNYEIMQKLAALRKEYNALDDVVMDLKTKLECIEKNFICGVLNLGQFTRHVLKEKVACCCDNCTKIQLYDRYYTTHESNHNCKYIVCEHCNQLVTTTVFQQETKSV